MSGNYPVEELCTRSIVKYAKICSEEELNDLILLARYGTKVLVRVEENYLENCSTNLNRLPSHDCSNNRTQHPPADTQEIHNIELNLSANKNYDQNEKQSQNQIQNQRY